MGIYNPPVDQLLKRGDPDKGSGKIDYRALGIGPEHVPDLIRMLKDKELFANDPEWYSQVHAWRALAQLKAREAIDPLLDLVAENAESDDWSDWILEELPVVLGGFGPEVIPIVIARIDPGKERVAQDYSTVITEVGKQHPEARLEAVSQLCRLLEAAATNDPTLNGFLISDLIELKATEAWTTIERAYATENVDESITGGLADAKHYLGLGPKPPRSCPAPASSHPSGQNAKQRFNERQRQKKLAKKKNKKKRK